MKCPSRGRGTMTARKMDDMTAMQRVILIASAVLLRAVNAAAVPHALPAYSESLRLETEGQFTEAAQQLEPLVPERQDDSELYLRLGWLWFQAGDYTRAWTFYERASLLDTGDLDARLGLAWTAARQGRPCTARDAFGEVLAEEPDKTAAKEGFDLVDPRCWTFTAGAAATGQLYSGNPLKSAAAGGTIFAGATYDERFQLAASLRYAWFVSGTASGFDPPSNFGQPEIYVAAAYVRDTWGLSLHYGVADDLSSGSALSQAIGVTGRLGNGSAEVSALFSSDGTVLRVEPRWRFPLEQGVSVTPSVALQSTPDGFTGSVALTMSWDGAMGTIWGQGRFGREVRPVYLGVPAIYNTPDETRAGLAVGAWLPVTPNLTIIPSYEWRRLRLVDGSNSVDSDAHFLTLGFQWSSRPTP